MHIYNTYILILGCDGENTWSDWAKCDEDSCQIRRYKCICDNICEEEVTDCDDTPICGNNNYIVNYCHNN